MIWEKSGVAVAGQDRWAGFGVEKVAYDLCWITEPGSLTLQAPGPTLYLASAEVGGRCEFRPGSGQLAEGGFFGVGALTFAAAGDWVTVHASEMRQARLCCLTLEAAAAEFDSVDGDRLARLPSRYMFRDNRVRTCAEVLERDGPGASPTYARALAKALFAALLEPSGATGEGGQAPTLAGAAWRALSAHIRDSLGEPVTLEVLAQIAELPVERFGAVFREATGLTLQQWQMDLRVRSAQRLLADNPDENLAEVAQLCGFADQSHFSRAFLKVVGSTPTAWLHHRRA